MFTITTTYRDGAPPITKPFTWSYSRLKNFRACPHKHWQVDILKTFKEEEGEALKYGNAVHDAMAKRVEKGIELPPTMREFEEEAAKLTSHLPPGVILMVEQNMAITRNFTSCGYFAPDVWYRAKCDVVKIAGAAGAAVDWKGLAIDTPIPTPSGFTTMGALKVGDLVFGSDGKPYPVMGKSVVKSLPCYEVSFTSGGAVVCDEEHLWQADGAVMPVTKLRARMKISLPTAAELKTQKLPIDPYVFGFWLADGKHTSGEATKPDDDIWVEIQRRGYKLGANVASAGKCRAHTILGIRGKLNDLGVLGNKHIPREYLWADVTQRQDLIRGIADGDGTVNKLRKQAVIEVADAHFAEAVAQVLRSLGERVIVSEVTRRGFGKVIQSWMVVWRPRTFNPFICGRKRKAADVITPGRAYLEIKAVMPVASVPTQCISVGSPDRVYLCGKEFVPTHNTGKINEDSEQLALMAQCVFSKFPQVQVVRTKYVWLGSYAETVCDFTRADMPKLWNHLWPELGVYEQAWNNQMFPPKPGGLCKRYCPVTSCQYHGKGSRP